MSTGQPSGGGYFLVILTLIAGVVAFVLSTLPTDATNSPALTILLFNSPIQPPPQPIAPVADPEMARILGARRHGPPDPRSFSSITPTPRTTPIITRTPEYTETPPPAFKLLVAQPEVASMVYMPHMRYAGWKGAGDDWQQNSLVANLNLSWWYDWDYESWPANQNGQFNDPLFVPMMWCRDASDNLDLLRQRVQANTGRIWLIFNEPDHPAVLMTAIPPPSTTPTSGPTSTPYYGYLQCAYTMCRQANSGTPCAWGPSVTPAPSQGELTATIARITAERYAEVYTAIKEADSTARVFCCGQFHTRSDIREWWDAFMARIHQLKLLPEYKYLTLDGVHLHAYPFISSTNCSRNQGDIGDIFNSCVKGKLKDYWLLVHEQEPETRGKPLWITEYGYLGGATGENTPTPSAGEVRDGLMRPMTAWLGSRDNPGYREVAWFSVSYGNANTILMYPEAAGTPPYRLTGLGLEWASYAPMHPPTSTPTP